MQQEIKNEWIFEQSSSEVWEYLTNAELIALWLMPNNFKPIAGYEFQFRTKPISSLDLDGVFDCKILEILPFTKLTYSWKGGPGNGDYTLDTVVEWSLEKYGNSTKLSLKHTGFKEANLAIFTGMTNGWQTNVQKIITSLNANKNGSTNV